MKKAYEEPTVAVLVVSTEELCSVSDTDTMGNKGEWSPWQ